MPEKAWWLASSKVTTAINPVCSPPSIDDNVAPEALVRVVDAFVEALDLAAPGFVRAVWAATGRAIHAMPLTDMASGLIFLFLMLQL